MKNRCVFKLCEQPMLLRRLRFTNVSQIASEWGACFEMHVEPEFLKLYMGPIDDDDGALLVGSLVETFDRVVSGRTVSRATSHGEWVSFEFTFVATRRKTHTQCEMRIRAVYGPCTSNNPTLFVECGRVVKDRKPNAQ